MRAKNEFKFIAEAYDTKLLAEKAVDGTLMCSKDCCGSPVMECKCGDDCPHCNCFMIQKAVKDFGLKSPLLEGIIPEDERDEPIRNRELPVGHYDHMVRLSRGGRWNTHTVMVRKTEKELIQKFLDQGFRIVKPFEDNEEIEYENPATRRKEAQRAANERAHKKWQDPEYWKEFGVKGLGPDTPKEDNEEPKRGITGYQHTDALAQAALSKDYLHKPYVSSYVGGESDGFRKIFAVLGSDGKIVHKTRDKKEAHQWLKDNYENI